ncbi:ATP-binding cassette domain-containing protein, partial [bacterium]|nr:ATP-binding cassette domain-containing protein [bacterium]
NIMKAYGEELLFSEVSLTLEPGKIYGLLGDNGAGKSTLAKIILGLEDFQSGRITLNKDGELIQDILEIKKDLYYVFQNPDHQIVGTIVSDDVAFGVENICTDFHMIHDRVNKALQDVGLLDFKDTNPLMLSGGQKQRLAIAGALAVHARYIILDEPSAMLDPIARKELWALLYKLKQEGLCILIVSHLAEEIRQCDHLYVFSNGLLNSIDKVSDFFESGSYVDYGIEEDDMTIIDASGLREIYDSL